MITTQVDMDTAGKSRQWPYSCYSVAKEMPGCYTGYVDHFTSYLEAFLSEYVKRYNVRVSLTVQNF